MNYLERHMRRLARLDRRLFDGVDTCGTEDRIAPLFSLDVNRAKGDTNLEILAYYR